jgi:hypothetical protein
MNTLATLFETDDGRAGHMRELGEFVLRQGAPLAVFA